MDAEGHLAELSFDGEVFTVSGTTPESRVAIMGPDNDEPILVLPLGDIERIDAKIPEGPWRGMANAQVTISARGRNHPVRFRPEQIQDMEMLLDELERAGVDISR